MNQEEEEIPDENLHRDGPSHHPSAPSDELFDISTTVDPSYVISIIRKLLPENVTVQQVSNRGSNVDSSGDGVASPVRTGAVASSENVTVQQVSNRGSNVDSSGDGVASPARMGAMVSSENVTVQQVSNRGSNVDSSGDGVASPARTGAMVSLENVTVQQVSNRGSNVDSSGDGVASPARTGAIVSSENVPGRMDFVEDSRELARVESAGDESYRGFEQPGHDKSLGDEAWEECGCVLWDLAASKTHAELMVENFLLEVLAANLAVQQSVRAIEISLGIIGNLACHEAPMKRIISMNGLIELIINQLFLDDIQSLCEACRLLSLGLRSSETCTWAAALQSEIVLNRVLWIVENSLNPQLIEKSVELLLAMIEGSEDVVRTVLPPLLKLGLPNILINLLACEIDNLKIERVPERLAILDVILRAIEALSVTDGHSQEISSNKKLFQLVCKLVKLHDKAEVANSCVTAAVLIANILSDVPDFALEISSDLSFLQGLLDSFPFASDDLEARSALWNIMAHLLIQVNESETSLTTLRHYVSLLASKSDIIEDDLLDEQFDGLKSKARKTALTKIIGILNQWTVSNEGVVKTDIGIGRLLDCCRRHTETQN